MTELDLTLEEPSVIELEENHDREEVKVKIFRNIFIGIQIREVFEGLKKEPWFITDSPVDIIFSFAMMWGASKAGAALGIPIPIAVPIGILAKKLLYLKPNFEQPLIELTQPEISGEKFQFLIF